MFKKWLTKRINYIVLERPLVKVIKRTDEDKESRDPDLEGLKIVRVKKEGSRERVPFSRSH